MTLTVHPFGAFLTIVRGRNQAAVQMSAVVKIIKKDAPTSPATPITDVDGMPVLLGPGNRPDVLRLFGKWGARRVMQVGATDAILVGVPGSSHTTPDGLFTAGRMAAAVAQYGPCKADPMLHFSEAMKPAHEGNKQARNVDFLVGKLVCTKQQVTGPVILVDDVVNTGAHMVACARKLRSLGATVTVALCVARAVKVPAQDPFNIPAFTIDT